MSFAIAQTLTGKTAPSLAAKVCLALNTTPKKGVCCMLSLQNARSSSNRILAVRCAVIILLCGALMMISGVSTTRVRAQGQPAAGKFRRVGNAIPNQYIVVLDDNTPAANVASLAGEMARAPGGNVTHIYRYALKGFAVYQLSEAAAMALSQDPRVEFVEEDGRVSVGTTQTNPPWGLDRIDQRDLPLDNSYSYIQTGSGVNAYIIDTGIRATHQQFGSPSRVSFGVDEVGDGQNGADCFGHGTKVASVVGGVDYGVAKAVSLINVRTENCFGTSGASVVLSGVDWVTANHVKPAVANVSLQLDPSTALDKAVRRSIAAGVTYVVIAGNQNADATTISPARVTQAITVGATDSTDTRWVNDSTHGSNFGSLLDLFSPGKDITTALASSDTDFDTMQTGTSVAAPHVAGAVALYLQTDATASPSTVSEIITTNATSGKITDPGTGSPNLLLFTPQTWPTPTYYSLSLNGTSAYVDAPNGGLGVSLDITGPITVEAWVKTTATVRQGVIERFNSSACTGTSDGGYALRLLQTGKVRFFTLKNGCEYDFLDSATAVNDGSWHNIAGVFTGSQMLVFVDGVQSASKSSTFAPVTGTSDVFIGRSADGAFYFNGQIDEARVTARALYAANFSPANRITGVMDTRGLWRFDRQNAKDAADINNGTLVGGATFSTSVP